MLAGALLVVYLAFVIANGTLAAVSRSEAKPSGAAADTRNESNNRALFLAGRNIFRHDTFGDEAFWGDALQLHRAIAGTKNGGVGAGLSPKSALALGLKVDAEALPKKTAAAIKAGQVDLDDPATTLALLKLNAVVGVKGFFDRGGRLTSVGITCALCHSTVDDSFAPGIGRRLDGWPNRDLNVGAIIALAPNLSRHRRSRRRRGDGRQGARQLGPGQVRRGALLRRQGISARRTHGGDADPAGLRARRRQPRTRTRAGAP